MFFKRFKSIICSCDLQCFNTVGAIAEFDLHELEDNPSYEWSLIVWVSSIINPIKLRKWIYSINIKYI